MTEIIIKKEILLETEKSRFWIIKNFTNDLFEYVNQLHLNTKPTILVYGRKCHQQRDVGFYSDMSQGYKYSNTMSEAFGLTPELKKLMQKVNLELGTTFNGILINRYNTGTDYLSAHSDSEKGLDINKMVAGLSYGAIRKFRIRDKKSNAIISDFELDPCMIGRAHV